MLYLRLTSHGAKRERIVPTSIDTGANAGILQTWLGQLGFTANPFALRQAGLETQLDEYFVEPPGFEVMRRPYTTLLFAPRGGGKTACRRMVERDCRPGNDRASVLAVSYDRALETLAHDMLERDWPQTGRERHVRALLRSALQALFADLMEQKMLPIYPDQLALLRGLAEQYALDFLSPPNVVLQLRQHGNLRGPFDLAQVAGGVEKRQLRTALDDALSLEPGSGPFLVSLIDSPTWFVEGDPLQTLANVVQPLHLDCFFVLVDGLDEFPLQVGDAQDQVDLLLPLLSDLRLMEHSFFKFKFFLPAALHAELAQCPEVRFDRLLVHPISWPDGKLRELLRMRLIALSQGRIESMRALFDDPDSVGDVDARLAGWANGSPRALLELGDELLSIHSWHDAGSLKLTAADWSAFEARFQAQYAPQLVPPLRVDEKAHQVFIGKQPLPASLTENEFSLLCFLYQNANQIVSKDDIWREVMGYSEGGASDTAIDSLIFRTRKKIEKDPRNPVYLQTVRGEGYVLRNVGETSE